MRILEFGPTPVVKTVYPESEETFFVGTGMEPTDLKGARSFDFGVGRIRQIRAMLDGTDFDAGLRNAPGEPERWNRHRVVAPLLV
jgi:hypothetical protein